MNMSIFAERLSELMFDRKLNAPALAKILNCGSNTITRYLAANNYPSTAQLIKLADFFNCSADYLLGLTDMDNSKNFKQCPPFKERLADICKKLDITKYRLQHDTKLPESAIYNWQNGYTVPNVASLITIAQKYNCTVDFLLGREL